MPKERSRASQTRNNQRRKNCMRSCAVLYVLVRTTSTFKNPKPRLRKQLWPKTQPLTNTLVVQHRLKRNTKKKIPRLSCKLRATCRPHYHHNNNEDAFHLNWVIIQTIPSTVLIRQHQHQLDRQLQRRQRVTMMKKSSVKFTQYHHYAIYWQKKKNRIYGTPSMS